jgi:DnaB-like helicase C terminal domain
MFATEGRIPFSNLRQGRLGKLEIQRLQEARKRLVNREIWIEDEQPIDVRAIAAKCRFFKRTGLDAIVVDYLQLVTPSATGKRDTSREREVAEISRSLKSLALELNLVVIALSQLNDAGQLRESRAIAQDADIILKIEHGKDGASIGFSSTGTDRAAPCRSSLMEQQCGSRETGRQNQAPNPLGSHTRRRQSHELADLCRCGVGRCRP